jgi:site-specific recombinase XerD
LEAGEIWVKRTWGSRKVALGEKRFNLPKSNQERIVVMSSQLEQVLQEYVKSRGGDLVWYKTPHALRHTYATPLLREGESPVYVKEQLGYHSIKLTVDVYVHVRQGLGRGPVEKLDQLRAATLLQPLASKTPTKDGRR